MNKGLNRTGTSPGQGAGVQLSSGRLVLPNNGGGTIFSDDRELPSLPAPRPQLSAHRWLCGCWLADGETWQDGSNWNPSGPGSAYGETQIALLSDRKTILNIGHGDRTKERYQMFAETSNGGESWGPVYRRPELVNVGCQQSMTGHTEDDGRHFLYYAAPRGGLMPLSDFDEITSRRDGVKFWPKFREIWRIFSDILADLADILRYFGTFDGYFGQDIEAMATIVEEAVAAGACGFSTSRIILHRDNSGDLTPGSLAQEAEMLAIARAIAAGGGGVFEGAFDFATYDDVPSWERDPEKQK